jgi:prophage regulatory protein
MLEEIIAKIVRAELTLALAPIRSELASIRAHLENREQTKKRADLVTYKELKTIYGVPYSRAHVDRLEKAGLFPARTRLGVGHTGRVCWRANEIEVWVNNRTP